MTPTIFFLIVLISLISGFLATFVLRLAEYIERRITGKVEKFDLLIAYCKISKTEFVLMDDVKKKRLNLIIGFTYNSVWGLLIPILLYLLIPANIIGATAGVAFIYLFMIMVVYFLVVHFGNLSLFAFYLNKENPFWKWGVKANLIEALKRFAYSVVAVFTYLYLSYILVFIIS